MTKKLAVLLTIALAIFAAVFALSGSATATVAPTTTQECSSYPPGSCESTTTTTSPDETTEPPESLEPPPPGVPEGTLPATGANPWVMLAGAAVLLIIGFSIVSVMANNQIKKERELEELAQPRRG